MLKTVYAGGEAEIFLNILCLKEELHLLMNQCFMRILLAFCHEYHLLTAGIHQQLQIEFGVCRFLFHLNLVHSGVVQHNITLLTR